MIGNPMGKKPFDAALIVAKKMGKGAPPADDAEGATDDVGLESAAEDILAAIKEDDPKALAESLKSAVSMCDQD